MTPKRAALAADRLTMLAGILWVISVACLSVFVSPFVTGTAARVIVCGMSIAALFLFLPVGDFIYGLLYGAFRQRGKE